MANGQAVYDPLGELQGPLPIPPRPESVMTGGGVPLGNAEQGGAGPAFQPRSPAADRMEYLQRLQGNKWYGVGAALTGKNEAADELQGLQRQDLAQQHFQLQLQQHKAQMDQFVTQKRVAIGGMIIQGLEATAKMPSDQRQSFMQTFGPLVQGLAKEVGYEIPPNAFLAMATTPGLATKFASTLQSKFGSDQQKINEVASQLGDLSTKDAVAHIETLYKSEVESAIPKVQKYISGLTAKIRSDPTLMSQLDLLDKDGKPKPIPGALIERAAASYEPFASNVSQAAVQAVLGDAKYAGFLANRGIQSGEADIAGQKTLTEALAKESTPGGQAAIAKVQAEIPLIKAQTGEAKAKVPLTVAQTKKAEADTAQTLQDTAIGKVLPTQLGGGIAVVKPDESGVAKVKIVQTPGATIQNTSTIRKDFETQAKRFQAIAGSFVRVLDFATDPSPGGDLGIVFSYMKMLEPESSVKEGEQATAVSARGIPDTIIAKYNRLLGGGSLAPNQRADFLQQAGRIMDRESTSHKSLEKQFTAIAQREGIDPANVVIDFMGPLRHRSKSTAKDPNERALEKYEKTAPRGGAAPAPLLQAPADDSRTRREEGH